VQTIDGRLLIRYFGSEKSVVIHSAAEIICESCFAYCESLTSVAFEANSRLCCLEKEAFAWSGLQSIHLPAAVEVICELCFSYCESLMSVTFETNSRLRRLEKAAFSWSGLQAIHLPGSIEVICKSCFSHCESLASVTFDPDARLRPGLSDLKDGVPLDCRSPDAIGDD
jgi:hypothetical protein